MKKVKLPIVGAVSVTTLVLGAAIAWWFWGRKSGGVLVAPSTARFQAQGVLTKQSSPVTAPPRAIDVEEDDRAALVFFS